mgnify:CR=1 FL=1
MTAKVSLRGLYKIFGPDDVAMVRHVKAGMGKTKGTEHRITLNTPKREWELGSGEAPVALADPCLYADFLNYHKVEEEQATGGGGLRTSEVVLGGDYITTESGTGLVPTAPGHGQDDYLTGLKYGLPLLSPVDDAGRFTAEAGEGLQLSGASCLTGMLSADERSSTTRPSTSALSSSRRSRPTTVRSTARSTVRRRSSRDRSSRARCVTRRRSSVTSSSTTSSCFNF